MTSIQKLIKYGAIAFAVLLSVGIIGGVVGAVAGVSLVFGDHDAVGDKQAYTVSDSIEAISIEIAAARLDIVTGSEFAVESNLERLTVSEKDGCLRIKEKEGLLISTRGDAVLTVTVPAGRTLRKVDITTGAGKVTVDALAAEELDMEFGAGDVHIDSLTATRQADIDGGAGRITVADGALAHLDLDMGVGALRLNSALSGRCEIDCGVGQMMLTLLGNEEDYTVHTEKGLGDITVDGAAATGGRVYGTGGNKVEINGGVGTVQIDFSEK